MGRADLCAARLTPSSCRGPHGHHQNSGRGRGQTKCEGGTAGACSRLTASAPEKLAHASASVVKGNNHTELRPKRWEVQCRNRMASWLGPVADRVRAGPRRAAAADALPMDRASWMTRVGTRGHWAFPKRPLTRTPVRVCTASHPPPATGPPGPSSGLRARHSGPRPLTDPGVLFLRKSIRKPFLRET